MAALNCVGVRIDPGNDTLCTGNDESLVEEVVAVCAPETEPGGRKDGFVAWKRRVLEICSEKNSAFQRK